VHNVYEKERVKIIRVKGKKDGNYWELVIVDRTKILSKKIIVLPKQNRRLTWQCWNLLNILFPIKMEGKFMDGISSNFIIVLPSNLLKEMMK
jgi:hypothetical protein